MAPGLLRNGLAAIRPVRRVGPRANLMHQLSLKCLGVGDGWPSERNHASFLYELGERKILIDCGEPISRSLYQSGIDYDSIDDIFLSHLHFDHIGGFFMLMQSLWLKGRRKDLSVHLPADGIGPIRQLLNAGCLFAELIPFKLRFEPLQPREPVLAGKARVTPFPTTHLETFREQFKSQYPQQYAAFCFLIEAQGLRVGHSADLGAPEDLLPLFERPLDLLVCELAHMAPEKLFRFLRKRPVKRIVFVHLSQKQWEQRKQLHALATSHLGQVELLFASDGSEINI